MTDSEGKTPIIVLLSKKDGTRATTPITGSWRSLVVAISSLLLLGQLSFHYVFYKMGKHLLMLVCKKYFFKSISFYKR